MIKNIKLSVLAVGLLTISGNVFAAEGGAAGGASRRRGKKGSKEKAPRLAGESRSEWKARISREKELARVGRRDFADASVLEVARTLAAIGTQEEIEFLNGHGNIILAQLSGSKIDPTNYSHKTKRGKNNRSGGVRAANSLKEIFRAYEVEDILGAVRSLIASGHK